MSEATTEMLFGFIDSVPENLLEELSAEGDLHEDAHDALLQLKWVDDPLEEEELCESLCSIILLAIAIKRRKQKASV